MLQSKPDVTYKDTIDLREYFRRQRVKTRKEYLDYLIWNKFTKTEIEFLMAEFDRLEEAVLDDMVKYNNDGTKRQSDD